MLLLDFNGIQYRILEVGQPGKNSAKALIIQRFFRLVVRSQRQKPLSGSRPIAEPGGGIRNARPFSCSEMTMNLGSMLGFERFYL